MDVATLAVFVPAVVLLAVTPGPDMALFLAKTVGQSRSAGLAALAGAVSGVFVHTAMVALGLSALLAASATAFTTVKVLGALYLLWLAVDAVRGGSSLRLDAAVRPEGHAALFRKGLFINLLNPKIIVFFVSFLPQFVAPDNPHASLTIIGLGVLFLAVATPVCVVMILFAHRLARLLQRSARLTRALDYAVATVFGAFAVKLLFSRA